MQSFNPRNPIIFLSGLIFFLFLLPCVHAQTYIPAGTVSGNWVKTQSPYIIQGDVEVESGESLVVEPGVEIRFESGFRLDVYGLITAIGSQSQPVRFTSAQTSPNPGDWRGINIYRTPSNQVPELIWCIIEYAEYGIYVSAARLTISDCTVRQNSIAGINVSKTAVGCNTYGRSAPTILRCTITSNSGIGVRYNGAGSSITGCTVEKTGSVGGSISESTISNNGSAGIYIQAKDGYFANGYADPQVLKNQIYGNAGNGIETGGSDPANPGIEDNQITSNNGSGILCKSSPGTAEIMNNIISGNQTAGITNDDESTLVENNDIYQNQPYGISTVHLSRFTHNQLYDNSEYDFHYRGQIEQVALNNDWGTSNTSEIDAHIYDFYDDDTLGVVTYQDLNPPRVAYVYPAPNDLWATENDSIIVYFDEAYGIDPESLDAGSFVVIESGRNVEGTISLEGDAAVFKAAKPLTYDALYAVSITTGVKDIAGNSLPQTYKWNFSTGEKNYLGILVNSFGVNIPDRSTSDRVSGLAVAGDFFWLTDGRENLYRIDRSGNIIASFEYPGTRLEGVAFDGTSVWVADGIEDKILQMDAAGTLVSEIDTPGLILEGLAFDGSNLWVADSYKDTIYEIDTLGKVISQRNCPATWPYGMAFGKSFLWVYESFGDKIYKMDKNGVVYTFFDVPALAQGGLGFDGTYLWLGGEYIYQLSIDPKTDSDADGYPDCDDDFPSDPDDWLDTDGDGVGDNSDVFPDNPNEWLDSDKDGVGNNEDEDDDNDKMPDEWEEDHGLNPLGNDAAEDKDHDEVDNYMEYLLDLDPSDPKDSAVDILAFVTRFYRLCLGRDPDVHGLAGWVRELIGKNLTGSDVAYGFVFSPEFLEQNTADDVFLKILYLAFFNRDPDPGGWDTWMVELAKGTDREHVLKGFIYAKEFNELCRSFKIMPNPVAAFVARFYQLCLKRDPDLPGLDGWVASLLSGNNVGADVAKGFMFSPEFINTAVNNKDYLNILYKAFFNRDPDPAGFQTWLDELNSGTDRTDVLNGFIYSIEFGELCRKFGISPFR